MTENEKNSPGKNTSKSSSSSTDSGVVIIDNSTTYNKTNVNTKTTYATDKQPQQQQKQQKQQKNTHVPIDARDKTNATKINIQNFINITKSASGNEEHNGRQVPTPLLHAQRTSKPSSKNTSPALSIRSTSISIVSIDENEIDSSVVDSDSDSGADADAEGVHSNYVVKKLGQQTTYPANSPDIPNIGKGLTVLSQQVSHNREAAGEVPSAKNLLNGGLALAEGNLAPSTPQIGSIALSNSTDVTFGDKHFYEGPVTIQQFLIDSRDKWKPSESDGQDNPVYNNGDEEKQFTSTQPNVPGKSNSPPTNSHHPYRFIFNRKAVIITGVIIVLTVLIGTLIVTTGSIVKSTVHKSKLLGDGDDSRKNIPINSTIGKDNIGGGKILRIVPRDAWLAQPPSSEPISLNLPISQVVVISTRTEGCTTQATCTYRVRYIQTYNIESSQYDDIIYNFLIGDDGSVYEGRGWDHEGAHLKGFNDFSISLAYIGTFKAQKPSARQMNVTQLLLDEGVRLGKLTADYKIIAANKIEPTSIFTSADGLYASFAGWPHWLES